MALSDACAGPLFVGSEIFRVSRHATGHPLAIPRVSLAMDLCRALGWLPAASYREAAAASAPELQRFHHPAYVAAVQQAERLQALPETDRRRFNLGVNGNPIYAEVFRRPATACGASLLSARLLAPGGVVFNPAGGTHHGQPERASGYCVFNDPVLAIGAFLAQGLERIAYLDLDAHFGDGVQQAFHSDDRVLTISIHEQGRWPMACGDGERRPAPGGAVPGPHAGCVNDRAGGAARNLPVPPGYNDDEAQFLLEEAVLPLLQAFRPEAIVVQCGADALACDPMTKLALSNGALWRAVGSVRDMSSRLLVLGGGGYNPWAVGRCWAGLWATLARHSLPDQLPPAAAELAAAVRWGHRLGRAPQPHWLTTLADPPRPGPIREAVRRLPLLVRPL